MAKKPEVPPAATDEAEARQQQEELLGKQGEQSPEEKSPPKTAPKPAGKVFVVVTCNAKTPLHRNPAVIEVACDADGHPIENAWEKFKEINGISGCADGFDERVVTAEEAAQIDAATDEAEAAAKDKAKAHAKRPL